MLGALTGANKAQALENKVDRLPRRESVARNDPGAARNENLHDAQPVYKGDPENQVIVFDLDETLIAGDKIPFTKEREKKINAMSDRKVTTISKNHPANTLGFDIKYVLRPGVKELLDYLYSRGYKMIISTRNYSAKAIAIFKTDPVLSKFISGTLGREDLMKPENKDFKKNPSHPDNLGFWEKTKTFFHKVFVAAPVFAWNKTKSIFTGKNVRWSPGKGTLGKHPPIMIDLLKLNGNHSLDGCKSARFLVDNKADRELEDSKRSGDFAVIDPNVDANGDGRTTSFEAGDETPKISLTDPTTGEGKEGYLWVKNVIDGIEKGWRQQFKETAGREPKKV